MNMTQEEVTKRLKALKARCERLIVSSSAGNPEEWRKDAEALDLALSALRPVSREQVEGIRGKWMFPIFAYQEDPNDPRWQCSECGSIETPLARHRFCPSCGAPMTDEAVEMVMERMEAMKDGNGV